MLFCYTMYLYKIYVYVLENAHKSEAKRNKVKKINSSE